MGCRRSWRRSQLPVWSPASEFARHAVNSVPSLHTSALAVCKAAVHSCAAVLQLSRRVVAASCLAGCCVAYGSVDVSVDTFLAQPMANSTVWCFFCFTVLPSLVITFFFSTLWLINSSVYNCMSDVIKSMYFDCILWTRFYLSTFLNSFFFFYFYELNGTGHEGINRRNVFFHFASRFGRRFSCECVCNIRNDTLQIFVCGIGK